MKHKGGEPGKGSKKQNNENRQKVFKSLESVRKEKLRKLQGELEQSGLDAIGHAADSSVLLEEPEGMDAVGADAVVGADARKAFASELRRAINDSDVVIEVLDARDPNGYRSATVEEMVTSSGKTLVLLLNKIDLVQDIAVVERWESYLKQSFPVCTFRAATTASRSKNSTVKFDKNKATRVTRKVLESGYNPLGASDLMKLLNNYTRVGHSSQAVDRRVPSVDQNAIQEEEVEEERAEKKGEAFFKPIVVSIVGMPNVGKSSVINSLLRNTNRVKTGNQPGITRQMQAVKLTSKIKLLDTPGVIMEESRGNALNVLRNCVKEFPSELGEEAVLLLLKNPVSRQSMFDLYGIKIAADPNTAVTEEDVTTFLAHVCDHRKLVRKGGQRDLATAVRIIIDAWNNGLIKGWCEPPGVTPGVTPCVTANRGTTTSIEIVSRPAPELDLENL